MKRKTTKKQAPVTVIPFNEEIKLSQIMTVWDTLHTHLPDEQLKEFDLFMIDQLNSQELGRSIVTLLISGKSITPFLNSLHVDLEIVS